MITTPHIRQRRLNAKERKYMINPTRRYKNDVDSVFQNIMHNYAISVPIKFPTMSSKLLTLNYEAQQQEKNYV